LYSRRKRGYADRSRRRGGLEHEERRSTQKGLRPRVPFISTAALIGI
jgi:hypothetical protein